MTKFPYNQIESGALVLSLVRDSKTWDALCARFDHADPLQPEMNTNSMMLLRKLRDLRRLGLVSFEEANKGAGNIPVGDITETPLSFEIRVSFGGMSLADLAAISSSAKGMAVIPVFGRPNALQERVDVFVLMPFNAEMAKIYTDHIGKLGLELGLTVRRADDNFEPVPFMQKVWDGICAAKLIVADCTQKNPNVFYEIGIAHTLGKKVVLITGSDADVPSDIKHYDFIPYAEDAGGAVKLMERLKSFIKAHFQA